MQSTVLPLNVANSVGGGSGTPTAGNWLVLIAGWNQKNLPAVTMAASDDAHAFWRPGNVTTSTWTTSTSTGNTRTAIWYTANPLNAALKAYAAPSGLMAGMAVLVVELSGTGAWDTVQGINTNYAAAATTLNLALGAPSASSFAIGAVCGNNSANGQAFLPASWTGLHTTTATNGTDHTCDAVLTSAILLSNSGSLSVNGTASSATDLSGSLIQFTISAASPIPAANNPNWPYVIFETAFGGGFQTPPDQLTWTQLPNRLWSWNETTGVQYQLGQIQATDLELEVDNVDNALASDNTGSPYYSNALNSNMSFEAGISPWTGQNGATIAQSSTFTFASSGGATSQFSLKVTPDGVTATPNAFCENVPISLTSPSGLTNTFSGSAWFLCPTGYATGAQVAINWFNSSHTYISTSSVAATALPASSTTWTQVSILNQTPPGTAAFANIDVQLSGTPAASKVFYVEEAALIQGGSVASAGLVTTGVPVRLRCAVGTIGGASESPAQVTANRWYVIQRNAEQWPQQIDSMYRRYVGMTATDIWSVMAAAETTPYRGEVLTDAPYAWWAMDDQPLAGGVQPTSLRNIAPGNTNTLAITQSAAGAGTLGGLAAQPQLYEAENGFSVPQATVNPSSPTYAVAASQGWMYGDPQSTPPQFQASSITTAIPGSAAWQTSGQAGVFGSLGWFLLCNDSNFPVLANGTTIEIWFNYAYYGSAASFTQTGFGAAYNGLPVAPVQTPVTGQPACPLTIFALMTASAPVAALQLDTSGHLNLITYNGATPTSNSIYTGSDLRSNSWHHAAVTLTTTTWTVYVDGGATAAVSGSATGMTSAWTSLICNGDLGPGGSSSSGLATALVQTATATNTSGATNTATLQRPTTAGNCLAVTIKNTANVSVSGVTVSPLGTADNFASAASVTQSTTLHEDIWIDPNCAGGQTSVTVTFTSTANSVITVAEISGVVTSTPVDQTSTGTTTTANTWSSGTTAALASNSEVAVGAVASNGTALAGIGTPAQGGNFSNSVAPVFTTAGQVFSGYSTSNATTINTAAAIVCLKAIGLVRGGNVALSHLAVYPSVLPQWRIAAHYWAAFTGFGLIPAPQNVALQWYSGATTYAPDGGIRSNTGAFPLNANNGVFSSAVVTANTPAGLTSGPSAAAVALATTASSSSWVTWTGIAPRFNVYTGANTGAEKEASVVTGSGESYSNGYGAGAIGEGVTHISGASLVQTAVSGGQASTPFTFVFPNPTTAGNCIIVGIGGATATSVTSITIGGAADNFAQAKGQTGGSSGQNCFIWTDANCASGTNVVITLPSGGATITVTEWSGIATSSPVDQTAGQQAAAGGSSAPFTWTSGTTAALAAVGELAIGVVSTPSVSGCGTMTASTTDVVVFGSSGAAGVPTTAGLAYHGTCTANGANGYTAIVAVLKTTFTPGASPPASASATGDTPGQRIERCLSYGKVTYPGRSIDPATLLVQAATDIGGQQTGVNVTNIAKSDGGLLYVDNLGYLHYDDKVQLAAEPANAWTIGPASTPYYPEIKWLADPQRVWNAISITPFSPEGLTLANIGPSAAASVTASQIQYGPQPLQFFSYLQSQSEMQSQANWLFTNFGTIHVRAENVRLDAAPAPSQWPMILGMNVGDPVTITMWQVGGGGLTWTMRLSRIRRLFEFRDKRTEASLVLELDWEPPNYWS